MNSEIAAFKLFAPNEDGSGLSISLMEGAPDLIWVVDKDFNLCFGNRIFLDHTALISGIVLKCGENVFSNITSPDYICEWKALYNRTLLQGEKFTAEIETLVAEPSGFIEYSFSPVYSKDQKVIAALIIGRDVTDKNAQTQTVRQSESMFRAMFENTWAVKLLINPDNSRIIDANEAAARFYGYPVNVLKEMEIGDLNIMAESQIQAEMIRVLAEGSAYFQFQHRLAGGSIRDVGVYSSVIEFKERKILHSIIHDITERTQVQNALRNSESNARAIMESTEDVIILLYKDGQIIDCNESHARRLNTTRDRLIGANVFDFLSEDISIKRREYLEKAYNSGNPVHFEDIRNNRWNEISMYPIYSEDQKTTRIAVFSRDITERKRMLDLLEQKNNQLLESETRFRKIFEESTIGIALVNRDFQFISANDVFCNMFGYTLDELKLLTFKELTHPDFLEQDLIAVKKLIYGDLAVYRTEKQYITKNGTPTWASVNISIIRDTNGNFLNMLALVADINTRKNAEKALLESEANLRATNATKDRFFSIIAHDLKSPINGILGLTTLLKEDAKNLDINTITQFASMINSTAQNTYLLLDDLLGWARLQQGQIPFEPDHFSLNELMESILDEQRPIAYQKMVELTADIPKNLTMFADINMIRTILRNLISNAIKFTAKTGRIKVVACQNPDNTMVSVSDTGVGMSEETTSKLFRIETSFSSRGTENEKGTGLGLLLCKEFTEKHSGKIWVESKQGKGSAFYISIPKSIMLFILLIIGAVYAQTPSVPAKTPKAVLYYFHPAERCPIDQSIEEVSRKLIQTDFAARIKEGTLVFKVVNTDEKNQANLVNQFEINAQALYLVTWPAGKEYKNDLTEFAFSTAHSNPGKFKSGLKQELLNALK